MWPKSRSAVTGKGTGQSRGAQNPRQMHIMLVTMAFMRRKADDELPVQSPEEALQLAAEISELTSRVRRVPGLEEGKVEEIDRGEDRILREYSEMNPRRLGRFLRDLSDLATVIQSAHEAGTLSEKQRRILELMVKKTKMRDFFVARRLLNKFAKPLEIKRERDVKLDRYRTYRRKFDNQARELKSEIARMKGVPMPEKSPEDVERARTAVEEYNEASASALVDFFAHAPCLEAITMALQASAIPELNLPAPKSRESAKQLIRVLEEEQVRQAFGRENMAKLVEAASFSEKRLEHFVKDYKWFQKQLQENVGWLSNLTAASSEALRLAWPAPGESVAAKIAAVEPFLARLPRSERALQATANLRRLHETGEYEAALRSESIYRAFGEAAEAKSRGTLNEEVSEREAELARIQGFMARLPAPDKLLAKAA